MKSEPTWKKQGFKSQSDYQEHLVKEKGFKSYHEKSLCKSLQKLTSDVKDPESLFSDIEFIRNITGCKIPIKKKKTENKQ